MKKIELEIVALSHSMSGTQSYAVVLGELNGLRKLPIVIGSFEAQAIAVALERMKPTRPLTHDLIKNFTTAFNIELIEVIINDLQEGVFYSTLVCMNDRQTAEIDSRTSDAIALAVRFGCPIYTYEHILDSASLVIEESNVSSTAEQTLAPQTPTVNTNDDLSRLSIEELQNMLNQVLEAEDYIRAAAIRDEINRRKK
ncbi:bifunctional nuclease domain-containing protein [Arachidicoccus sp.]|jgi:bifunctional DNase/RNase|uniref:bifunctional nuclease family protein n=1 Tax=Arachidicoccus sp. TaxID=1872624 RepID=UPI003D233461